MKLEDHVCSLELSKKLKEVGIKPEGFFCWTDKNEVEFLSSEIRNHDICFATFMSSELAEKLPNRIVVDTDSPFNSFRLRIEKSFVVENEDLKIIYLANYRCDSTECHGKDAWMERTLLEHNIYDENMSNCLAKLLIKLIEHKIINIKKKDK